MVVLRAIRKGSQPTAVGLAAGGEETALQVLHEEEEQAERLASASRLFAAAGGLVLAAIWLLSGSAPPGVGLAVAVLAVIAAYAVPLLVLQWRRHRPWLGYLGMTLDTLALGVFLAALSTLYPWPGGAASALHFPAWLFFPVIIAGNALSFQHGRILAAGGLSALVTLGLALFARAHGARFGDPVASFSGPDLSVAGVATQVCVLLLEAALLRQGVARARATIRRAAAAEEAAATFGRYFSPAVARRLLAGGGGTLRRQRVEATIVQSDVRGFTTFSERMAPEAVLALLNTYFEAMLEILFRHDGTVIGFQGDGLLAAFGVPESRPDDAERALRAVREMLARAEELGAPGGPAPGLRIGIALHSGEVVAGNLGSRHRLEYTVLGDTVNTTARIEALNRELGTCLLVSGATLARLGDAEELRPVGRFELRGRSEPVELYTPEALLPARV